MCIIANASPQGLAAVLEVNFKTASGEQSRTCPETSLKWNGDTVRLRKRPLPYYGLVRGSTFTQI